MVKNHFKEQYRIVTEIIPIILIGGSGRRLWPISRQNYPKQFLPLVNETTMLQDTVNRIQGLDNLSKEIIVVCNEEHKHIVSKQLKDINIANPTIIIEPVSKNTAPAICAGSLHAISNKDPKECLLLVLPSDHMIDDVEAFHQSISSASKLALQGRLVALGVVPSWPSPDYGYIKTKEAKDKSLQEVEKFVEKPEIERAKKFLNQGGYFWNSGIFVFRADIFQDELKLYENKVSSVCQESYKEAEYSGEFIHLNRKSFQEVPNISIDYALFERTKKTSLVQLNSKWSDLGGWIALYDHAKKDINDNAVIGDAVIHESKNSYIYSPHRLTAVLGINEMIVVDTPDALLVSTKENIDQIRALTAILSSTQRTEEHSHRKVYRPWGWYDSLEQGENFQVKRICLFPKSSISLQKHKYRSEHWTMIKGEGKVICGSEEVILQEDKSIYIPVDTIHRLENYSDQDIEIIEVQYGSYLGEDDIVRFEDMFGRE